MKNLKNKLYAIGLIACGIGTWMLSTDATMLIVTLVIGIPLFFAKENWIEG